MTQATIPSIWTVSKIRPVFTRLETDMYRNRIQECSLVLPNAKGESGEYQGLCGILYVSLSYAYPVPHSRMVSFTVHFLYMLGGLGLGLLHEG